MEQVNTSAPNIEGHLPFQSVQCGLQIYILHVCACSPPGSNGYLREFHHSQWESSWRTSFSVSFTSSFAWKRSLRAIVCFYMVPTLIGPIQIERNPRASYTLFQSRIIYVVLGSISCRKIKYNYEMIAWQLICICLFCNFQVVGDSECVPKYFGINAYQLQGSLQATLLSCRETTGTLRTFPERSISNYIFANHVDLHRSAKTCNNSDTFTDDKLGSQNGNQRMPKSVSNPTLELLDFWRVRIGFWRSLIH